MKACKLNIPGDGNVLVHDPTIQPGCLVFSEKVCQNSFSKLSCANRIKNESASKLLDVRIKRRSMTEVCHSPDSSCGRQSRWNAATQPRVSASEDAAAAAAAASLFCFPGRNARGLGPSCRMGNAKGLKVRQLFTTACQCSNKIYMLIMIFVNTDKERTIGLTNQVT